VKTVRRPPLGRKGEERSAGNSALLLLRLGEKKKKEKSGAPAPSLIYEKKKKRGQLRVSPNLLAKEKGRMIFFFNDLSITEKKKGKSMGRR